MPHSRSANQTFTSCPLPAAPLNLCPNLQPTRTVQIIRGWFGERQAEFAEMGRRAKAIAKPHALFDICRDLNTLVGVRRLCVGVCSVACLTTDLLATWHGVCMLQPCDRLCHASCTVADRHAPIPTLPAPQVPAELQGVTGAAAAAPMLAAA